MKILLNYGWSSEGVLVVFSDEESLGILLKRTVILKLTWYILRVSYKEMTTKFSGAKE